MKINIYAELSSGPYGGGNQFLKALKKKFINNGCYEDNYKLADILIFNSHHSLKNVCEIKYKYPKKILIHRVDGPLFLARGKMGRITDKLIFYINHQIADAIVFQSDWSRKESYKLGYIKNKFEKIIINAPDPEIFYPIKKNIPKKFGLIASSWSNNQRKGFYFYHFLLFQQKEARNPAALY